MYNMENDDCHYVKLSSYSFDSATRVIVTDIGCTLPLH